jgi:hypothetical protein
VNSAKHIRARLAVIEHLLSSGTLSAHETTVLRNGVFPESIDEDFLVKDFLKNNQVSNHKLSFTELCRFNSFFTLYPEKIAGKIQITSSRDFPVSIKGTKQDIISAIENTVSSNDFKFQITLKKQKAKAKLKLLSL